MLKKTYYPKSVYACFFTSLLIVTSLFFNSCKDQSPVPHEVGIGSDTASLQRSTQRQITFEELTETLRINGDEEILKLFSTGQSSLRNLEGIPDIKIRDQDSVGTISMNGHTTFTLATELTLPHSRVFRNVLIDYNKDSTKVFLMTYQPDGKWIDTFRKTGETVPFSGRIEGREISIENLQGQGRKKLRTSTYDICSTVQVYTGTSEKLCGCEGHHVGQECVCDQKAFYYDTFQSVTICQNVGGSFEFPQTGGSGGSGGGTNPDPGSGYTPCPGGPVRSAYEVPNCNQLDYRVNDLMGILQPADMYQEYLVNNQSLGIEVYGLLSENGFSAEAKIASMATIKASYNNAMATTNDAFHWSLMSGIIPHVGSMSVEAFASNFALSCALLKLENPGWSNTRIYWEASKDMVHLALDLAGLVPVVGEVADLANSGVYLIQGDGVNATLSAFNAIPVAGWFSQGIKVAKKTIDLGAGKKATLIWRVVENSIHFGDRRLLRKVLKITDTNFQAHHIIPWEYQWHSVVQKAAKDPRFFHLNSALNGIPIHNSLHNGSHINYSNSILAKLTIIDNAATTPQQAYDALVNLINTVKTAVANNPGTHINNLSF